MIVRERPNGLQLFLMLRGSILHRIWRTLLLNTLLALAVTYVHGQLFALKITVTMVPFTLIGLPLAIFLGFRNNTAYDRYWEARKRWGDIVQGARSLSRQCLGLIDGPAGIDAARKEDDVRVRMVLRAAAFAHALRQQLRGLRDDAVLQRWLTAGEWQRVQAGGQGAVALLQSMGRDLGDCVRAGRVDACLAARIDATLTGLETAATACERIRNTPVPFSYTLLLHRTAYMYCFLLPFGLVDALGFMTPFVVAIVAYTFFGLDALGDEIEEPFGLESNDLPLDTICRGIEIQVLQALGSTDVPAPLEPGHYRLT